MPTTTQQNTVVARWVLVGKAAVLRSIVGDHYEAVEQLALAHSQILASCGSHRIKAYAVAPMLCRAYAEAGLAHSAAAKSLVATVTAAVDENCSGCKWWHCINWIERLLGGERSGDWLALRAHMTAATTPDDLETILRQLNSAAARGYTPTTTEGSQGASELALVGMAPPGQADEERLFWSQVPSSLNAPLRSRYLVTQLTGIGVFVGAGADQPNVSQAQSWVRVVHGTVRCDDLVCDLRSGGAAPVQ